MNKNNLTRIIQNIVAKTVGTKEMKLQYKLALCRPITQQEVDTGW